MNEEFEKWWDANRLSFSGNSSNKPNYLKAFLAGAAAMKERCAEMAELFDTSYDLTGDELMRRGDAALEVAAAIRKEIGE